MHFLDIGAAAAEIHAIGGKKSSSNYYIVQWGFPDS